MSALSIRHMNYTLARREQDGSMKSILAEREKSHYWFIERKARRGWIFVRDFIGTKQEVTKLWCKHFRGRQPRYRLLHKLTY